MEFVRGGGIRNEKEKRFERYRGGRNDRIWEIRCGGEGERN